MERSNFFGDQFVLADDLNNIATSVANQVKGRSLAGALAPGGWGKSSTLNSASVAYGGVFGSPADYLNTGVNFGCALVNTLEIAVAPGKALSPTGELIINPALFSVALDTPTTNGRWTNSPDAANYVKLSYQETSSSIKADDVGTQFPTRYAGSFLVVINSTPPTSSEIILAQFLADPAGEISGPVSDKRLYVRYATPADSVILDPTVKPVSAHTTVEDHVRSVGTGSPSVTNPHGLTLADLGGAPDQVGSHRKYEHVPGIFFMARKTAAALLSYSASIANSGGFDSFVFTAPTDAALSAAGGVYSGSLAALSTAAAPAPGTYDVLATISGTTQWQSTSVTLPTDLNADSNHVWLARATITATTILPGTVLDKRQFYTIAPDAIRGDKTETVQLTALSSTPTLAENLNRIRGYLSQAISGSTGPDAGTILSTTTPAALGTSGSIKSLANQFSQYDIHWQNSSDISGMRALNGVYQNISGRSIHVVVNPLIALSIGSGVQGYARLQVGTDPAFGAGTYFYASTMILSVPDPLTFSLSGAGALPAYVPAGLYYTVTTASTLATVGILNWIEYS